MKISIVASIISAALVGAHAFPESQPPKTIIGRDALESQKADMASLVRKADDLASSASADHEQQLKSLYKAAGLDGETPGADDEETITIASSSTEDNGDVVIVTEIVTVTADIAQETDANVEQESAPEAGADETTEPAEDGKDVEESVPVETSSPVEASTPAEASTPVEETPTAQSSSPPQETSSDTAPTSGGGSSGETFSGDGTYYTPGLGSCGKTNTDSDLIAAINAPQYGTYANPNLAEVCGKCALVKGSKGEVKVTITDRCPVCKHGDIDLSPSAFEKIGEFDDGRIPITWSFVDC
ncbi:hypothetical protein IW147_004929 [Coemansia sp. RSA 720]|nr:hypothetical protein IW147_004929 [Coemansia sp. RSA 720]